MKNASGSRCKRCGSGRVKRWNELNGDEMLLAEKLPMSAGYTPEERKKHRFCTKCWHEERGNFFETA